MIASITHMCACWNWKRFNKDLFEIFPQLSHHPQRCRLNQRGFRQRLLGLRKDAFTRQYLQNGRMVELLVGGIRVDGGQRLTVEGRVAQTDDNLWFQLLGARWWAEERLQQVLGHTTVERECQQPVHRGALLRLIDFKRKKSLEMSKIFLKSRN